MTLCVEGTTGFRQLAELSPHASRMLVWSTASAVYLTVMGMVLVKMLGASAAQIAGKLNILVTVALSSAFLGEFISMFEVFGALTVLCGAAVFERSDPGRECPSKARKESEKACL